MTRRLMAPLVVAAVLLAPAAAATAALAGTGGTGTAPPALIANLSVKDTPNAHNWSIRANLRKGNKVYGDSTRTFTSVPAALVGAAWIRDAGKSRTATANPLATFTLSAAADVYVGLDSRATRPAWLDATWSATATTEKASGGVTYRLFRKTFPAGAVALGPLAAKKGATALMYTIAAVAARGSANDFSVAAAPAGQSVTPGQTATYTVHTTVVSGAPDAIALTLTGPPLPAGVTATFSPNPVAPGHDATLTVATSRTTPNGTVPLAVRGTDSFATHDAAATLVVGTVSTTSYEAEAPGNTLFGGATRRACAICSGGGEVGNILGHGKPDALQFNAVTVPADGGYRVTWDYIAGDPNGDTKCGGEPNPPPQGCRPGNIVVNGVSQGIFQFPDTPNWHTLGHFTMQLRLKAGANTIKISSGTSDVADIDRIVVET